MDSRLNPTGRRLQVAIGAVPLLSLLSSERGTALVLLELGAIGCFAAGIAVDAFGPVAPWLLLAAVVLGCALRTVDLESCALFIPGGVYGTAKQAYGGAVSKIAASALIVEHLVFGAL